MELQVGWISGMPRSGTTWLSQIFSSSPDVRLKFCPLFSYEFKNSLDENSTTEDWERLFRAVYSTNSEFLDQEHLRKRGLIPSFQEKIEKPSHLVIKSNRFHQLTPFILKLNSQVRSIYVARHPCATLYSWLSNPNEFPSAANPLEEWKSGACRKVGVGEFWGFDDWKKVTTNALRLTEQYPDRHKIIRYENIVANTTLYVEEMFDFFNLPLQDSTIDFIKLSRSKHDNHQHSVFKKPQLIENWRGQLDSKIVQECLNEIEGTELEQFI
ncbi:sulfotransferase family protein [Porticoccus sp. Uisw_050_02]|uniref:sulfotransferase family protein n=1 Tax=Porticoccus sp. Uisw_050_02 TaxID=3230978 RepID=UPI0039E75F77